MDTIVSDIPQENTSLIISTGRYIPTIDEMVALWLKASFDKSGSEKTKDQYERNMAKFRAMLHKAGLELDSQDDAMVATIAELFASSSEDGRVVAGATYNQRIASVSSFFQYAKKRRWIGVNPMEIVERRVAHFNHAAMPFALETVIAAFEMIDTSTLQGKRDYALLAVLFATGRRVSELVGLRCGDIAIIGSTVTITWTRCKGNKVKYDQLDTDTAEVLIDYLTYVYGNELPADAPVWISNSKQNRKKRVPIGGQAIANICKMYLNDSRVHACRHSAAIFMQDEGATLSEIAWQLGHENEATTSRYLKRWRSAENKYAGKISKRLGIKKEKSHADTTES